MKAGVSDSGGSLTGTDLPAGRLPALHWTFRSHAALKTPDSLNDDGVNYTIHSFRTTRADLISRRATGYASYVIFRENKKSTESNCQRIILIIRML